MQIVTAEIAALAPWSTSRRRCPKPAALELAAFLRRSTKLRIAVEPATKIATE
jgi:hypothetical protein